MHTRETYRGERADGRHQFDYLRRLAENLKQQNEPSEGHQGDIKAIGILGSDVYDKLLVLQALRSQFPQAQFFTTDVDARLLHPQEFKWARNIVVASSFGLRLRDELQGDIPPFRDTYQTSLFFSTLLAVAPDTPTPQQQQLDSLMQPRLFEIGRRSAYGLDRDAPTEVCDRNRPLACKTIHPESPDFLPQWVRNGGWLYIPGALLLMVIAVSFFSGYGRGTSSRDLAKRLPALQDDAEKGISSRISLDVVLKILEQRRARAENLRRHEPRPDPPDAPRRADSPRQHDERGTGDFL